MHPEADSRTTRSQGSAQAIDPAALPTWVVWLAQDADGAWWGFEVEPLEHEHGWYENEVGRRVKLGMESANPRWRQSLRRVR